MSRELGVWHNGRFYPPIAGGETPPDDKPKPPKKPEDETVSKTDFDRVKADADRRETLLREKQRDLRTLTEEHNLVLEALGLATLPEDPDERKAAVAAATEELKKSRKGKTYSEEEIQKLLADRDKKHQKDVDEHKKLVERRTTKLREVLIRNEALSAAVGLGATEAGAEAIVFLIEREADLQEEQGTDVLRAIIKGKDGPRPGKDGQLMTIKERVAEIATEEKYATFFKGGKPGSGTPPGGTGAAKSPLMRVTRAQLADTQWYEKNRDELDAAQRQGRVEITD